MVLVPAAVGLVKETVPVSVHSSSSRSSRIRTTTSNAGNSLSKKESIIAVFSFFRWRQGTNTFLIICCYHYQLSVVCVSLDDRIRILVRRNRYNTITPCRKYGGNRMGYPTTWYDNVFRFRFVLSREASSMAMQFLPPASFHPYPSHPIPSHIHHPIALLTVIIVDIIT